MKIDHLPTFTDGSEAYCSNYTGDYFDLSCNRVMHIDDDGLWQYSSRDYCRFIDFNEDDSNAC